MKINEYRVIKNNYGLPQLSVRQSYQINYNNEPDIIKVSLRIVIRSSYPLLQFFIQPLLQSLCGTVRI